MNIVYNLKKFFTEQQDEAAIPGLGVFYNATLDQNGNPLPDGESVILFIEKTPRSNAFVNFLGYNESLTENEAGDVLHDWVSAILNDLKTTKTAIIPDLGRFDITENAVVFIPELTQNLTSQPEEIISVPSETPPPPPISEHLEENYGLENTSPAIPGIPVIPDVSEVSEGQGAELSPDYDDGIAGQARNDGHSSSAVETAASPEVSEEQDAEYGLENPPKVPENQDTEYGLEDTPKISEKNTETVENTIVSEKIKVTEKVKKNQSFWIWMSILAALILLIAAGIYAYKKVPAFKNVVNNGVEYVKDTYHSLVDKSEKPEQKKPKSIVIPPVSDACAETKNDAKTPTSKSDQFKKTLEEPEEIVTTPQKALPAPPDPPKKQVKPSAQNLPYKVIGGAFKNKTNAEKFLVKMKKTGYKSEMFFENSKQTYYVTLSAFATQNQALEFKDRIRRTKGVDCWIYKK